MIRVLIIDDSLFMRTIIRDMLEKDPGIEVIGTAIDGMDALEKIEDLSPDVITLDIEMPKMNGLEVLKNRSRYKYFPKTLMLSSLTSAGAEMTRSAMELGADDFMLKPKDVRGVRGIDRELRDKIRNLMSISYRKKTEQTVVSPLAESVVLIGSSAGGPPMLDILLSSLHSPIEAAMVITQHMPEGGFTASLATRLNRISSMPVKESDNGDTLNKGHVYVSKAGYHTIVSSIPSDSGKKCGMIVHARSPPVHSVRPAVDKTFISGASVFGSRCISAILSGMGNDGGEGMASVKSSGGKTLVCREEDCLVYGMARSALSRNCVDKVVPLSSMGDEISALISGIRR